MDLNAALSGAVTVQSGDTLVVAFGQRLRDEEFDYAVYKIAEQLPSTVKVTVIDGVAALAVVKGDDVRIVEDPHCPVHGDGNATCTCS